MSRGGWKAVAMVVRYEHASEERLALLAQALNPHRKVSNLVPFTPESEGDRAHGARTTTPGRKKTGGLVELPTSTSENDEECSGGEIRTHNLAGALELDEYQHPLE